MRTLARKLLDEPTDLTYAFASLNTDPADAASYTFTGVAIGAAGFNRTLIIVTAHQGAAGGNTETDLKVNGVSVGAPIFTAGSGGTQYVTFYAHKLAEGTTADFELTLSATATRCLLGVYAVYDLISTTPRDTGQAIASPYNMNADIQPGHLILAAGYCTSSNTGHRWSWTNATEDGEIAGELGARWTSLASHLASTTGTRTVTPAVSGGTNCAALIVLR
jgi:hypothetical protein